MAASRWLGVPASQVAHHAAAADAAAQAQEAEGVAEPRPRVAARWLAWAAAAQAAIGADAGRGPGRRGRQPRPGRDPVLPEQGEAVSSPTTRSRRGRPPQAAAPQGEVRSRLGVPPEALAPSAEAPGWPVLATTVRPAVCTATALLQASQEQQSTVAPGLRGSKHPAALSPGWREQPARMAA
jgi:hypothetical protein